MTELTDYFGYICKVVTDADSGTAMLRFLEEKSSGRESVLSKSDDFEFSVMNMYEMILYASGPSFWCAISNLFTGDILANLTGYDKSFTEGYIGLGSDMSTDNTVTYFSSLAVDGTVLSPSTAPTTAPAQDVITRLLQHVRVDRYLL